MTARPNLSKGLALFERASRSIPGGVLGFHKLMAPELYPPFLCRGDGAYVVDMDGNRYLDYILGKGPIVLGYRHPAVQQAVHEQLDCGNLLSSSTPDQVEVAEMLLELFPRADMVRFHKSGSEACAAAVRLARIVTGKTLILSSGYHGWHDWCSPGDPGVPAAEPLFIDFRYDLDRLERALADNRGRVAAIFVEPVPGFLRPEFYRALRELADSQSALLIFDEVKTGMRVAARAVQHAVDVVPDMTIISKAIANGFCLSCVLGSREALSASEKTHISTTYDIEAAPFAAARATLRITRERDLLATLEATAARLVNGLNEVFGEQNVPVMAFAMGSMFRIAFAEPEWETPFYSSMAGRGVLLYPYDNHFVSLSHGEAELARTIEAVRAVIREMQRWMPPQRSRESISDWQLHQFSHRKGFLRGAAGPTGRAQ